MTSLEDRLLAAHAAKDIFSIVDCYSEAAQVAPTEAARGFYLTQAYVCALEADHPAATGLRTQLRALGREE